VCSDFENCTQCIENAEFRPEPTCLCMEGFSYDAESNSCSQCHPWCKDCSEYDNLSCTECNDGYFLQAEGSICLQNCPTGYIEDADSNSCIGVAPEEISCVTFDKVECYDWDYNPDDLQEFPVNYIGGVNPTARDGDEPVAIYNRGLYFDGVNDFLTLTGPDGFMLN